MIACRGYGLDIGPGAAIMAQRQRPRAINRSIPRSYVTDLPSLYCFHCNSADGCHR